MCNAGAGPQIVFNSSNTVLYDSTGAPHNVNGLWVQFPNTTRTETCSLATMTKVQQRFQQFLSVAARPDVPSLPSI